MGNLCSSATARDFDQWPVTEEELQARYLREGEKKRQKQKERDSLELVVDPAIDFPTTTDSTSPDRTTTTTSIRKAEAHCAYMIPEILARAKAKPDLTILDVGCGSGIITVDLAEMCGARARVVGLDVSAAVLASARVYAESRGVGNVEFVQGSVYDLEAKGWGGKFDVVCTHQVLAHLGERIGGIRELVKVVRKGGGGGVVCMREGDLSSARFGRGYPDLQECFGVIVAVHEANGGAADAGRQLEQWTVKAGVKRKDIVASRSVWSYDTAEGRREYGGHWPARCTQGVFAEKAMELGVSSERLQEYALAWKEWIEDEKASFSMMHGEVIVRVT